VDIRAVFPNAGGMREPLIPQLDAEEFLHWEARQPEKFELHHGFIMAFAGGTFAHNKITNNVRIALDRAYPPPCETFSSDVKVGVGEKSFFYPDVGVVCDPVPDDATVVTAPILVCEILSEGTRSNDLVEKRAAYRSLPSLRIYLIVHTRLRRVELDSRGPNGKWTTSFVEAGSIAVGRTQIDLDEIYARTEIGATT
jgi:Uma2 family endonuclease